MTIESMRSERTKIERSCGRGLHAQIFAPDKPSHNFKQPLSTLVATFIQTNDGREVNRQVEIYILGGESVTNYSVETFGPKHERMERDRIESNPKSHPLLVLIDLCSGHCPFCLPVTVTVTVTTAGCASMSTDAKAEFESDSRGRKRGRSPSDTPTLRKKKKSDSHSSIPYSADGPVYDSCNEIRRKIRSYLKKKDTTITTFLQELGGVNFNSYRRFMAMKVRPLSNIAQEPIRTGGAPNLSN